MILWEDDLPGPLPIGQVSFRSNYLPSYEVHLSQTTGVDGTFFEPWKCSDQMHWFILQGWVRVPVGDQLVSRQKTFYWKQKYVMERFRTTTRTSCNEDGWRPSERHAWIVMEELKPYAARTVTFFRTGDDPVVKSFYDKRLLRSTVLARHFLEAWRRTIRRSRCLTCMFCCLHFCCLCMTCACLKHWRYKTWLAASVSYEVGAVIGSEAVNF